MRRALIIAAALALVGGVAIAGEYHFGETLQCSQCHTMHASQQHSYSGSTNGYPRSWDPTEFLLKGPVNEMCLACHDESFAPDVLADNGGGNRSAGALNTIQPNGAYSHWMGHTLGSLDPAPGDVGSFVPGEHGLTCVDCHHQHGYAGFNTTDVAGNPLTNNFRNLVARGGKSVSYAVGTNDLSKDVFETEGQAYEADMVNLNEPVSTDSGFATWCTQCHKNFHGQAGDEASIGGIDQGGGVWIDFVRHPNATVNIGATTGGHSSLGVYSNRLYRVRVMSPTGDWGTQGTAWAGAPADLTPTCLSCHKAHGSAQPYGLIYALGENPLTENGDGTNVRDLCKQCHVQGG